MPTRIVIADDHAVVCHGLSLIIKDSIPFADIDYANNFSSLQKKVAERYTHLVICDVNMPGNEGMQLIAALREIQPDLPVLIFSVYPEDIHGPRYLQEGANGYLHKDADVTTIHKAIADVLSQKRFVSDQLLKTYIDVTSNNKASTNPFTALSNRELEIAILFAKGNGTLEVSNALNIHVSTVSTYKRRLLKKLRISSIPELLTLLQQYKVQIL